MMKSKVAGIALIIGSLYYVVAEAVCATFFNASFSNAYVFHTISELGIPNLNSPLFWLMNSAFILVGLALIFGYFYRFKDFIVKNKAYINHRFGSHHCGHDSWRKPSHFRISHIGCCDGDFRRKCHAYFNLKVHG